MHYYGRQRYLLIYVIALTKPHYRTATKGMTGMIYANYGMW